MSKEETAQKLQTNEEMVEELTKDLVDYSITDTDDMHSTEKHETGSENDRDSDAEEEKSKEPNLNDHIDEDELKQINSTLTDVQRHERRNNAMQLKAKGNAAHKGDKYLEAVQLYTEALRLCPIDNQNDRAVLYCNRAASKIQLQYKKSALDDCSKAIELNPSYVRAYLRRAKLYEETDKLDESLQDFKSVLEFDSGNSDALKASIRLPPLINERNEKMKTEMLGKLKDLGNMILKPFGLSTNNFQLQQDPSSGGYSINFQQNPK